MKKHSVLGWNLRSMTTCGLGAIAGLGAFACDGGSSGRNGDPDAMVSTTVSASATMPEGTGAGTGTTSSPTATGTDTTSTAPTSTDGAGGAGGMAGDVVDGAGGMGGTMGDSDLPVCDLPTSLATFARSDTDAEWDDNDFSDVIVEGTCPFLVNVTWPHEEGWENADPSDANFEQTHFTLDSYYSTDLTGKMLSATIELTDDQRGPSATTGGYIVSIVSVANYNYEVIQEPVEMVDTTLDAGASEAGVVESSSDASTTPVTEAGVVEGGLDAGSATIDEPMVVLETGYAEAETLPEDRVILRHVGDRATVTLPLPDNTEAIDSYDPARVIKINIRIYNMHVNAPTTGEVDDDDMFDDDMLDDEMVDIMSDAGMMSDAGVVSEGGMMNTDVTPAGLASDAGMSEMPNTDDMTAMGEAGAVGMMSDASAMGPATDPTRVYDYITSQFAITEFKVVDQP